MPETRTTESITVMGGQVLDRVKALIHEGNVRRIVIKQGEQVVVEFPLTLGVVGTVVAPVLAAVGVLAALLTECTIEVERIAPATSTTEPTITAASETPVIDEPGH
jgi:hypothetical protein